MSDKRMPIEFTVHAKLKVVATPQREAPTPVGASLQVPQALQARSGVCKEVLALDLAGTTRAVITPGSRPVVLFQRFDKEQAIVGAGDTITDAVLDALRCLEAQLRGPA